MDIHIILCAYCNDGYLNISLSPVFPVPGVDDHHTPRFPVECCSYEIANCFIYPAFQAISKCFHLFPCVPLLFHFARLYHICSMPFFLRSRPKKTVYISLCLSLFKTSIFVFFNCPRYIHPYSNKPVSCPYISFDYTNVARIICVWLQL